MAIVFYMVKKDVIPDIYASERRTRMKPLISAVASQLIGVATLIILQGPQVFVSLMSCYVVNSVAMTVITQVWKISIHASGITAAATFLVYHLGPIMFPFFMLVLPVGWARIKLKAHNLKQIIAGSVLTIILVSLQLNIFR
jgi:membrane-associated phospholipid phosphatase